MAEGTGLPPQLVAYWTKGEGAGKINWGVPGDFDRCVVAIQEAVTSDGKKPLADRVVKGLCSTLHVVATGARPGQAPGEKAAHGG